MTRLLWPALATLVVVAIGAPCLTFYLLIKEYWAEVTLLRQELLICQFGSSDLSAKSLFSKEGSLRVDLQNYEFSKEGFQTLPDPLPLTMDSSFGKVEEDMQGTNIALNQPSENANFLSTISSPSRLRSEYVPPLKSVLSILASKDSPFQSLPERTLVPSQNVEGGNSQELLYKKAFIGGDEEIKAPLLLNRKDGSLFKDLFHSPRPNQFSLDGFMISDDANPSKISSYDSEKICLQKEYVEKVEKRVIDLTARVDACRKCLEPSQQKESRCGGGAGWREHRRKEKLVRRQMREEKRKRRKKEKNIKDNEKDNFEGILGELQQSNLMPESSNIFSTTTTTTPSLPLSDAASFIEWRPEDHTHGSHNTRENHRASTDFRRGFNQKISRMDEALMQFTETQSAFCKELRDNLGGRLEKRGQELEALSEQIAAFVRTTTTQVSMIEKLTSDQVYAGQTNIEKNLANLQVLRDAQMKDIEAFHKKTFVPAMVILASFLSEQASSVTNMGVELITKVEMLQDVYLTFSTQQGDTLVKLSEAVDMFASKHNNLIMRSRDHAKYLHMNTENFIRELQTRMNNVVKELVLVRLQSQSFVSVNENTFHEISSSLNKTHGVVDSLSTDLRRRIDKAKEEEVDFRKSFRQETDLINARIETGISQVLMHNHGAVTQVGEVELETRVFSDRSEAAWNEVYVNQETELRQEADMLTNNLRSHNHHTQNILTGLQGTAGTHEQVLEQQRMDFQSFIRKRQDALDTQCSSISDWALLMSSELRRRDEDLHKFLSEGLHSPSVTVQEDDYEDFLVSRLPDGTLLYDSSSSDNFHSNRRPTSNMTSEPEMKVLNDLIEPSVVGHPPSAYNSSSFSLAKNSLPSSSMNISTLPNSSLTSPPSTQKDFNSKFYQIKEETVASIPTHNISRNETSIFRDDVSPAPGNDEFKIANESLSNDIKITGSEELDNFITNQNDQGVMPNQTNNGCSANPNSKAEINKKFEIGDDEANDEEFKKLKDIVNNAKETVLKFKKEFQINDNFPELKKTAWKRFIEKGKQILHRRGVTDHDDIELKKIPTNNDKKVKRKTNRGHKRHKKIGK